MLDPKTSEVESAFIFVFNFAKTFDPDALGGVHSRPFPRKAYIRDLIRIWIASRRIAVPKSRQMLGTWLFVTLELWDAYRHTGRVALFKSLDLMHAGLENNLCLLGRAKHIHDNLPRCVQPIMIEHRRYNWIELPLTESKLWAFSMEGKSSRQLTGTSCMDDELAIQENAEAGYSAVDPLLGERGRYTCLSTYMGEEFFWQLVMDRRDPGEPPPPIPWPEKLEVLSCRTNARNGFVVPWKPNPNHPDWQCVHYSADPDKNPATERGHQWFTTVRSSKNQAEWDREYEGNPLSHIGKRIFPAFNTTMNHERPGLEFIPELPLIRGWDPSVYHSVCVFMQIKDAGKGIPQLRILGETDVFSTDFGKCRDAALAYQSRRWPEWNGTVRDEIDRAGRHREASSNMTPMKILGQKGIVARWRSSSPEERISLFSYLLEHRTPEGEPCLLLDPAEAPRLRAGFMGLYRRKRDSDAIDKQDVVDNMDALGYGAYNHLYLRYNRIAKPTEPEKRGENMWDALAKTGRQNARRAW
jgi:hypothetical protein